MDAATRDRVEAALGRLPLYFIENRGQTDPRVVYYVQGATNSVYFTKTGIVFALTSGAGDGQEGEGRVTPVAFSPRHPWAGRAAVRRHAIRLDFEGANPEVKVVGRERASAVVSYFKGRAAEWKTALPTYAAVVYEELWPGIDLVYGSDSGAPKYSFLVKPGADPARIRLVYRGASAVRLTGEGRLTVDTPAGGFTEERPYAYQEGQGTPRREVAASFEPEPGAGGGEYRFGFRVGAYDRTRTLVLDPVMLVYCGFVGGSGADYPRGVAVDGAGNAYIAGYTNSTEASFPVTVGPDTNFNSGAQDAFVAKINAAGTALLYCGYIGGTDSDYGYGIAVDGTGNAYVVGDSVSITGFPVVGGSWNTTQNGGSDAFVAKVNGAGTALVYCGYIGGAGEDYGRDVAVDGAGSAYVTGYTSSGSGFPATVGPDTSYNAGANDAFVAKINAAGSALVYCGYVGGSGDDKGHSIAVDGSGNAYLAGETNSTEASFPDTLGPDLSFNGTRDGFVAKINAAGTALAYCGFVGGSGDEIAYAIAVDGSGNAYVAGYTASTEAQGFPVVAGSWDTTHAGGTYDAFVAKINAAGTALVYCGYIGGSTGDYTYGIAVDGSGNAYVMGNTNSTAAQGFPVTAGPDLTHNGGQDVFVAKINAAGTALVYCGYIGGTSTEGGWGIAVDGSGSAYVVGTSQSTEAQGFPIAVGPDLTHNGGTLDAFVAKIAAGTQVNCRAIGAAANLTNQGTIAVTAGSTSVTKTGGTGWKAANRGRGDRLAVGLDHYVIARVDSDDALTLASPALASYTGSTYTIARQFATLQAWESCVSFAVACPYFPVSSASLVADDRREIGIAYDDATPSFTLTGTVSIQGSTTDASHSIILTADQGNRHDGVAGAGVVVDANGANEFDIRDSYVTVEWLEFVGAQGHNIAAIQVYGTDGDVSQNVVLQNLLIHDFGDQTEVGGIDTVGIDLAGDNTLVGKSLIVRNTMIWAGDHYAIEGDGALDTALIENVSVDGMAYRGIYASGGPFTVRNTIVTGSPSGDFVPGSGGLSGSNNSSTDTSANFGANARTGVTAAAVYATPNVDLHLKGTAGLDAIDTGLALTSSFAFDIDGQLRPAGVGWDRGADEFGATTAVRLMSFSAVPGDGSVTLEWRTGSELGNLGFHLYRGPSADGPWTRLTSSLIPGLGSSPLGQAYSWLDTGLVNGTTYYYRLEDVDASSTSTFHGPVFAVPSPPGEDGDGDGGGDGTERGEGEPGSISCPSWVLSAAPDVVSPVCTRHGDPDSVSLQILARDSSSATLELHTKGFWALHDAAGEVRVFVPGLEFPSDPKAPALPLRRALVEAVVGKEVHLVSAEALDLRTFRGLRPSSVGAAELAVRRDGTVRPARRALAPPLLSRGYQPRELARLAGTVFQGERKSAVVEMTPVRFSGSGLVLAGRVLVRLAFTGVAEGESGAGSRGRVAPSRKALRRDVVAQLHTTRRGVHAVRFEQLFPQGRRGLSTSLLRLQRQGEAVAFHVEPQGPVFGPGSTLYFFADRTASSMDYSSEVAYELVRSSGVRMGTVSAPPLGVPMGSSSTGFSSFETNRIYQPGLLEAEDLWLWDYLPSGARRTEGFALSGVDTASGEPARLVVHLQGGSESGRAVDHHVELEVNGARLGETSFAGKRPHRVELLVPASLLREGGNELSVVNVGDTGVVSGVFLDRFEVSYPQASRTTTGVFEGVWADGGTVEVGGLTGPAVILRDSGLAAPEGSAVRWLTGFESTGSSVRFQAEPGQRYVVVSAEGLLTPRTGRLPVSTLRDRTNQADYLVIAPQEMLGAAQPLLERRRGQGLSSRAVAFEEIASEFGHGQPSAEAIREFLKSAWHSWQRPSPRYVLLLGDATEDPRHFVPTSWASPLPALWTKTSYLWTVSDPALGAVNGEDLLPDLAIGRLPATTREEAEALVSKLLAWEDSGQGLVGNAVLVADQPDAGGDFEADVEDIRTSFLSGRATTRLRVSELGAATRGAILEAFDEGASLMSYVGHGGTAVWSTSSVLSTWDVPSLRAQSLQPVLLTMNCLNGYFVAPNLDALPEALLKAEGRGAIAAFSPSGLSLDGPAHQYHRAVVAELASGAHDRLGDAILAAQRAYAETGLMPELISIYQLLGDPAMKVH